MSSKNYLRPMRDILSGSKVLKNWIWVGNCWIEERKGKMRTVTKLGKSKKGTVTVFFDNQHDYSDAYYCSQKIQPPSVGDVGEAQVTSKTFDDGKEIWFLNGWKPVNVAKESNGTAVPASAIVPIPSDKAWKIDFGDCSRFVSNVVGSAIAAGLIKDSADIHPWIVQAYEALQGLRSGKPVEFNDRFTLPDEPLSSGANRPQFEDGDPGPDVDF